MEMHESTNPPVEATSPSDKHVALRMEAILGFSTKRLLRLRNSCRQIESPTPVELESMAAVRKELRDRSKRRWNRINSPSSTESNQGEETLNGTTAENEGEQHDSADS